MIIKGTRELYFSENFQALAQLIAFYSLPPIREGDLTGFEIDSTDEAVSIELILGWAASGGTVEGFPCFFSFTPTAYAKTVQEGVPNRLDADGNPITWADWHDATHSHVEIDGVYYVPSNPFGEDLSGAIIKKIHDLAGANALMVRDYQKLLPSDSDA